MYRVRQGPMGPKKLCNACGLRWAKKASKNGEGEGEGEASASNSSNMIF